jgi:hypothetical protein
VKQELEDLQESKKYFKNHAKKEVTDLLHQK